MNLLRELCTNLEKSRKLNGNYLIFPVFITVLTASLKASFSRTSDADRRCNP